MPFKDALHISSTNLVQKIALPDWAKYLTEKTRKIDLAFTELKVRYFKIVLNVLVSSILHTEQQYMTEMVEARRNADKVERYDLFSGLLDAAQDEHGGEGAISNEELIGGYINVRIVQHSWKKTYPPFQETCLYFFLLDMRYDLPPFPRCFPKTVSYRPQRIRYALHLRC